MEYKYTNNGKKVIVIGSLNSKETIVQEIYISGESEIPSGEHFTVKSLHDEPMKSWKEVKYEATEKLYNIERIKYQQYIEQLKQNYIKESSILSGLLKSNKLYQKHINSDIFKTLDQFLSGEITQLLKIDYNSYNIINFKDALNSNRKYDSEYLKLITLFGKDDGTFNWRISQYSDGSGGSSIIEPCISYDDAVIKLNKHIISELDSGSNVTLGMINAKIEHNLDRPNNEEIHNYNLIEIENLKHQIETSKLHIEKNITKIQSLSENI